MRFPTILECPQYHFFCRDRSCIDLNKWCDGVNDCSDGSDEDTYCKGNIYFSIKIDTSLNWPTTK